MEKAFAARNKSVRKLIWLNPLLRYGGFEPKARGIRAMLPYVDDFKTAHNIKSLMDLSKILSTPDQRNLHFLEAISG